MDTQWCVKVSSACVCCYRCCYRWLVQARSPEFHRDKSLTVFSWDVVRWGGGVLFGVSERGGVMWVQGSHSLGKKLLSSLAERALILRYRLPEGRSWKRLWEGWVGSSTILFALLEHRVRKMSRMEGRGAPMIFAAVFTVRWRVLRSAAQLWQCHSLSYVIFNAKIDDILRCLCYGLG